MITSAKTNQGHINSPILGVITLIYLLGENIQIN